MSARAVGESISLDCTAAFLFTCIWWSFWDEWTVWAHAGTPQCVWPAGGLVLPTGLVGHRMLVWVLCYVCIIYNKMGVEAEPSACLGRCTYNTEKADIQTS